jgi:crotonobetainyl-CoA:carnitine CoA-transferase CaiB-like acyl-CoA transferase
MGILDGVRILEVAEHTFVPAASALLADYGAEVIKIEPHERGDAMRGLQVTGSTIMGEGIHPLLEHSNRGKKSLGLNLATPEGLDVLYRLVGTCDVFLTNKLPGVRRKLIYVRGTGQGERGPDADKGSYDSLAFWARSGVALAAKRPEYDLIPIPPAPGFGDSLGAMTIAGGIMGALFQRERTGETSVVDVSLLGVGLWAMGQAMALSLVLDKPWAAPPDGAMVNPLSRTYVTKDDRLITFTCLQLGKYWPLLCAAIGREDLAADERFKDMTSLSAHSAEATALMAAEFATATLAEWKVRLAGFTGQWAVCQDTLEAAADPQTVANGYLQEIQNAAGRSLRLVTAPVQYDEQPAQPRRAPEFNEHGDDILAGVGLDWDTIVDLKVRGAVT